MDAQLLVSHGETVEFSPRIGDAYEIGCVLSFGEAVQNDSRVYATAWAPLASFTGGEPAKGDVLTHDETRYRVADIEKDSAGGRLLKLSVIA